MFSQDIPSHFNFNKIHKTVNHLTNYVPPLGYNLSFNYHSILNTGHPNIDNNSEILSLGSFSSFYSSRFSFASKLLILEVEPYLINHQNLFQSTKPSSTFDYSNHKLSGDLNKNNQMGIRQSRVAIHFKNVGLSFGKMSHWWGPGSHSSIVLTSNSQSQTSYTIGTLQNIKLKNYSFGIEALVIPYKNQSSDNLFFSGLNTNFKIIGDPVIELGFQRTFLSGNLKEYFYGTNLENWNISNAAKLIFEPLFNRDKTGLDYTVDGTPGFDIWDLVLSGHIKFNFIEDNLSLFVSISSDDARGNLVDLRAHWDHTIGYQMGFQKLINIRDKKISILSEYLSTKISNTLNPQFYRGDPNQNNFYTKSYYDHFTYKSRRMGAHSGTSSDDLVLMIAYYDNNSGIVLNTGLERHGIKSMVFPSQVYEQSVTYFKNVSDNISLYFNYEYEQINNFNFEKNSRSVSQLFWISASYQI